MARFGALGQLQLDHLHLFVRCRFGKYFPRKIPFFITCAKIAGAYLKDQISALQMVRTDSAFTRIMGNVTTLGSTVQRHDLVGAKCSVAHGRYIQDTGLVWFLAAPFSNLSPLAIISRQI